MRGGRRPRLASIAIFEYYSLVTAAMRRRPAAAAPVGELQTFKAQFFRALAHPVRIRILEILVRGGRTVQELQEALTLDQPIVSQQLAVLRNQNVVAAQKEGSSVPWSLALPWRSETNGSQPSRYRQRAARCLQSV